jgi:hypothetical protein
MTRSFGGFALFLSASTESPPGSLSISLLLGSLSREHASFPSSGIAHPRFVGHRPYLFLLSQFGGLFPSAGISRGGIYSGAGSMGLGMRAPSRFQNGTTHHSDQDDEVHPNGMSARRHPSESHPRSPSASLSPPTPPPSVHLATPPGSGPQVSSSPSSR